jgi:transcriptional regulator with XRE-family HTH domain
MKRKSTTPGFGQRLAVTRGQRGLSQSAVAYRAGLAPSYLSRIETGKIQPTVPTAQKIAAALRIPLSDLLAPSPAERKNQGCPVTARGTCLIDLIDPKGEYHSSGEHYSPRQIRLLRRFTAVVREGSPELLKGLDLVVMGLLDRGTGSKAPKPKPKPKKSKRRTKKRRRT